MEKGYDAMAEHQVTVGCVQTPAGEFGAVFTSRGLARLTLPGEPFEECAAWVRRWEPQARIVNDRSRLDDLAEQLTEYFEGKRREFSVPLDLRGTPFQLRVWGTLLGVHYGEVHSYKEIALSLGNPQSVRAVGAANGANPVAIIVPCHRIIGSGGHLVGYGGGIEMKRRLLELEGVLAAL